MEWLPRFTLSNDMAGMAMNKDYIFNKINKSVITGLLFMVVTILQPVEAQDKYLKLKAHMQGEVEMWDGTDLRIWGFIDWDSINANVLPSPTLVLNEGDSVKLLVDNVSEMPHTVHLHGLDVDQQNDGVPSTSFQIADYRAGYYHFKTDKPGTYLYHCHVETVIHLQMGMYGAIIVRPKAGDNYVYDAEHKFNKEYLWLTSEIDSRWHEISFLNGQQPEVYYPDYVLINGKSKQQITDDPLTTIDAVKSDTVLLRLANMGYGIHVYHFPSELNAEVIGSDGRKFENSFQPDTLALYPGERYAVLLHTNNAIEEGNIPITYYANYRMQTWGENTVPYSFTEPDMTNILNLSDQDNEFEISHIQYDPSSMQAVVYFNLNSTSSNIKTAVFNLQGKKYHEEIIHSKGQNSFTLNVRNIKPGIYVLQIMEGNRIRSEKIIMK